MEIDHAFIKRALLGPALGLGLAVSVLCHDAYGWSSDSTSSNPICTAQNEQAVVSAVSSGDGGIYLSWQDSRKSPGSFLPDIYSTHLGASGLTIPSWRFNGTPVCSTSVQSFYPASTKDGFGGVIIAYFNASGPVGGGIYAQRFTADGQALWPANGVLLSGSSGRPGSDFPALMDDGLGGAFVVWIDGRFNFGFGYSIFGQHVSPTGQLLWPAGGIEICTSVGFNLHPSILFAGNDGLFVSWRDNRISGKGRAYIQHLDGNGNALWTPNGLPVSPSIASQEVAGTGSMAADGAGGVYVGFSDNFGSGTGLARVQRLNSLGVPSAGWPDSGLQMRTAGSAGQSEGPPLLVPSGAGGAFATWLKGAAVLVQRVSPSADRLWSDGAAQPFGARLCSYFAIVSDSADGVIVGTSYGTYVIAQHLDSNGAKLWGSLGLHVASGPSTKKELAAVADGAHGAVFAWSDQRSDDGDIYAQNVNANGSLGGTVVATTLALQSAIATPDRVVLRWDAHGDPVSYADLQRSEDGSSWSPIATLVPDGSGTLSYVDTDVLSGRRYAYRLQAGGYHSAITWVDVPAALTAGFDLAHPQPAAERVDLRFTLSHPASVRLAIYDVRGRRIRLLADGRRDAGQYTLIWRPGDGHGMTVPSGVYFARLEFDGRALTQRIVLAR